MTGQAGPGGLGLEPRWEQVWGSHRPEHRAWGRGGEETLRGGAGSRAAPPAPASVERGDKTQEVPSRPAQVATCGQRWRRWVFHLC